MGWWCGGGASGRQQPDPLARWPAPVIAVLRARAAGGLRDRRNRPGRRDPACTHAQPVQDFTEAEVETQIGARTWRIL